MEAAGGPGFDGLSIATCLLFAMFFASVLGLWIWALVDSLRRHRVVLFVLMLVFGPIVALVYLIGRMFERWWIGGPLRRA